MNELCGVSQLPCQLRCFVMVLLTCCLLPIIPSLAPFSTVLQLHMSEYTFQIPVSILIVKCALGRTHRERWRLLHASDHTWPGKPILLFTMLYILSRIIAACSTRLEQIRECILHHRYHGFSVMFLVWAHAFQLPKYESSPFSRLHSR